MSISAIDDVDFVKLSTPKLPGQSALNFGKPSYIYLLIEVEKKN